MRRRPPLKTFKDMAAYLELIRPLQGDDGQGRGKYSPGQVKRTVDGLNKPQEVIDQGKGSEQPGGIGVNC
jgi:hypothetical protein